MKILNCEYHKIQQTHFLGKYQKKLYKLHNRQYNKFKLLLNNSINFRIKFFVDTKRFVFNQQFLNSDGAIIELLSDNSHQFVIDVPWIEGKWT